MVSSSSSSMLFIAAALLVVASASASAVPAAPAAATHGGAGCYSHFFAFGDSLIDTGNFLHYSTAPGPVARSPYGETFFHRPTGRWSDGRLIVDFIVERLGLPSWPAYLEGKSREDFRHGANFAVASGTALSQLMFKKRGLNVNGITLYSLGVQMGWFNKVLAMLASTEHERREIMAKSLFLVGEIGANDYNHPFFQNRTQPFVETLMPAARHPLHRPLNRDPHPPRRQDAVRSGHLPARLRPEVHLPLPRHQRRRRRRLRPGHRLPAVAQRPRVPPQRAAPGEARRPPRRARQRRRLPRLRRLLRRGRGDRRRPGGERLRARHGPRRLLRRRRLPQRQLHRALHGARRRAVPGPVGVRVLGRAAHDGGRVPDHGARGARRPLCAAAHHGRMQQEALGTGPVMVAESPKLYILSIKINMSVFLYIIFHGAECR